MTAAERKQYLQSIGVLPPDETQNVQGQPVDVEQATQEQTPAASPEAPKNDDPREKLRTLMTPEFMQNLRKRAGKDPGAGY